MRQKKQKNQAKPRNDKTKPEEPRHGTRNETSKEKIKYSQKNTTNKKQMNQQEGDKQ